MRILIVTPAPPRSRKGNRVTAVRWARLLREMKHRVQIAQQYEGQPCDLLVALHAVRSAASVGRFRGDHPGKPLVVALTGTDLYAGIHHSAGGVGSLELADRLIVLQQRGITALPRRFRCKAQAIYQSVRQPRYRRQPLQRAFQACVLAHLRPVKDPLRAALAVRRLPASSRIRVLLLGGALDRSLGRRARAENDRNARFRWLGETAHWQAMRHLSRSRLLVVSSILEGGANVVSEALAHAVPVLSTHIDGSVGMLGDDYPGYFPVGDTGALTGLLLRAESDPGFYGALQAGCRRRAALVAPAREQEAWRQLIEELAPTP